MSGERIRNRASGPTSNRIGADRDASAKRHSGARAFGAGQQIELRKSGRPLCRASSTPPARRAVRRHDQSAARSIREEGLPVGAEASRALVRRSSIEIRRRCCGTAVDRLEIRRETRSNLNRVIPRLPAAPNSADRRVETRLRGLGPRVHATEDSDGPDSNDRRNRPHQHLCFVRRRSCRIWRSGYQARASRAARPPSRPASTVDVRPPVPTKWAGASKKWRDDCGLASASSRLAATAVSSTPLMRGDHRAATWIDVPSSGDASRMRTQRRPLVASRGSRPLSRRSICSGEFASRSAGTDPLPSIVALAGSVPPRQARQSPTRTGGSRVRRTSSGCWSR